MHTPIDDSMGCLKEFCFQAMGSGNAEQYTGSLLLKAMMKKSANTLPNTRQVSSNTQEMRYTIRITCV